MPPTYRANLWKKTLGFWLVFMVMYGVYRFFPVFPLSIICGTTETVFQHFKAAFFAYLITAGLEYWFNRKRISDREGFLYSRLQSALFIPWVIFLIWYIAPALGLRFSIPLEIVWANFSLLVVAVCVLILERSWETAAVTRAQKTVIWALVALSAVLFVRFTFGPMPWTDVFIEPDWRE